MTWPTTRTVLLELFHRWKPLPAQLNMWHERCERLNQSALVEAIQLHRIKCRYNEPNLGEVLDIYAEVMRQKFPPRPPEAASDDEWFTDCTGTRCHRPAQEASILAELLAMPRDELLEMRRRYIARYPMLNSGRQRESDNMTDDPNQWHIGFRGMVWAFAERERLKPQFVEESFTCQP